MRALLLLMTASLLRAETGTLTIHMILHVIGEERYEITPADGALTLKTTMEISDRGNKRTTTAEMRLKPDYTPQPDFKPRGASPFAVQMVLMRYWLSHGQSPEVVGHDTIAIGGRKIPLTRYAIDNLIFGRETLWMDAAGNLAAAMTFAGGLPMEAVRTEYEPAFPQLYKSGVAQEMVNLQTLTRAVKPEHAGSFAITGANSYGWHQRLSRLDPKWQDRRNRHARHSQHSERPAHHRCAK